MRLTEHLDGFPDLPPIWLAGFGVLVWLINRLVPWGGMPAVLIAAGWLILFAGAVLIVWSALWFMRKRTRIEPRQTPSALIVEGPYKLSRNPIYLGMACMLLGFALTRGGILPLVTVPAFMAVIQMRFIGQEEQTLRQAFGVDADAYLSKTA